MSKMINPFVSRLRNTFSKYSVIINAILTLLSLICCFIMLENSSRTDFSTLFSMHWKHMALNVLTIGILWSLILILCNRVWISCLTTVYICGILSIINYYVTSYHGMPLSFLVLKNFATAMAVASSYSFSLDVTVWQSLVVMFVLTLLCVFTGIILKNKRSTGLRKWIRNGVLIILSVLIIIWGYEGNNPAKPTKTIGWLWTEAYYKYGFAACTVESFRMSLNPVAKPDGYSEGNLQNIEIPVAEEQTATPDVILIMNETFYDLHEAVTFTTDLPFMQNIESMEDLLTGYAVVPVAGGATNSSEYELLTSNSMKLMPGITPFNTLDLYGANNITSYLNELGYHTTGSHSETPVNYSRGQGYYALGFQDTHFNTSFRDIHLYHDRYFVTDQSAYSNLIRWYEESPEDQPRFQYLLTIQNHGHWDLNASEYDIVHVQEDFGEYTDYMNEYLTSIYMADEAFKELTEYFASVDRPVIICMVGDHCPSFASSIIDETYIGSEKELLLRKVPLYIWANYELEQTDLGTMSMNYVVPTLLDLAEMPLTPYYRYMLQSKKQVPIITSYGEYYDSEGNVYKYDDPNAMHKEIVDDYFNLEYYNIQKPNGDILSD